MSNLLFIAIVIAWLSN